MGNSIVNHHVESAARQKYISETGQKLSANAQAKVNQQAAKNLNQTLADARTSVNAATQSTLGMLQTSQQANADAEFAADEARRISRHQGVVDNANGLSASIDAARSNLTQRHNAQISSAHSAIAKSERFTHNDTFEVNYGFESELVTANKNGWVNKSLIENTLNQYANDNFVYCRLIQHFLRGIITLDMP
ncbi:hypothetical protein PSECIP111951_04033 [Pseudoalteromonas holothuriae]|uniref:Uncharacterized protein n=1 Tax=Pseudoalteromonas holothuriae TaxID=2963714 RepID=A0ABN8UVD1_9GAMM|nr:hypothetical protein [Pseudoalteromonas sp. CIP111951]CAH9068133.1 hypothetical protein PSECIP111951_04033 [Pseudoalteromonas sp. CIP111951]